VYLWGWGWSSLLRIRLAGDITAETLIAFMGCLKEKDATPLQLNGNPTNVIPIFRLYRDRIRRELHAATPRVEEDLLKLHRYWLISISHLTGPEPRPYKEMPDADRAMLHSILYGKPLSLAEWAEQARTKKLLLTPYPGPGFALTNFDEGTLVFLGNAGATPDAQATLACHASNLATLVMMIRALLSTYNETERWPRNRKVASLRKWVRADLKELPNRYKNLFCDTYYRFYGPLRKMLEPEQS
jgi:hypothetical protein